MKAHANATLRDPQSDLLQRYCSEAETLIKSAASADEARK
jgi:hypothetical protein